MDQELRQHFFEHKLDGEGVKDTTRVRKFIVETLKKSQELDDNVMKSF